MLIIAHRGDQSRFLENTLGAFRWAFKKEADGIELDVWRCASGEFVVHHDEAFWIQGRKFYITGQRLIDLQAQCELAKKELPTLEAVVELISGTDRLLIIDLKGRSVDDAVYLYYFLQRCFADSLLTPTQVVVSSFQIFHLEKIRSEERMNPYLPQVQIAWIVENILTDLVQNDYTHLRLWGLHLQQDTIHRRIVQSSHSGGIKILAWTVNNPDDWKLMQILGVDGIFTDFPSKQKRRQSRLS